MSDWAEDAMLKAFPRDGTTYFLQLVDEPVLEDRKGEWGPYTLLTVNLQFFAIDESGEYHYMGPVQFKGKSCVFECLASYRDILLEVCYKVTGFKHGRHVDLKIDKTFDRQYPSRTQTITTPPTPPAVAVEDASENARMLATTAAAEPCPYTFKDLPKPTVQTVACDRCDQVKDCWSG